MTTPPTLHDLIGIEYCKQGFYQELQSKVELLKKSNEELEKKRLEMQAVLDGITDLMVVLSEDMRIKQVNHVFHQCVDNPNPLGQYCYEVLRNRMTPCDNCPAIRSLDTNAIARELIIYKVDGRYRQFDVIASPLQAGPTGERQVLLFKRDVTMEKEYQAKFYQAEKMATIGTLAAGIAHEINNPLTAISGFAEGLSKRLHTIKSLQQAETFDDFVEYTNIILKECLRCRDIVQTMLSFSRPLAGKMCLLDLNQCVHDTLFLLKHHFKEHRNLVLQSDLAKNLPPIMGDESQLKQVIINLLTNAMDSIADNDGCITVQTQPGPDHGAELIVRDNGEGITADVIDKLFEPFFTTKPVGKGIGIGLSTCYSIVKNHQGEINVESTVHEGASFIVSLPGIKP